MSASIDEQHNQSIDLDELAQLMENEGGPVEIPTESTITILPTKPSEERLVSQPCPSSSSITQAQHVSLSLEKSLTNIEGNSIRESSTQSKLLISTTKTSNIPGPVGLLPILKTNEDLRRLKEDKTARDTLLTKDENANVKKRPKSSADLFSLNINNYPSYTIALRQLHEQFRCEPISIQTALVKARLGIKKRIPLMCAAVTHYNRQENTILLDKTGHIRATFIGDDELLDNFNIHVGHTLVLRNVAVFTSTRHRHHYVNIYLQNMIAIQDPLAESFSMPLMSKESQQSKSVLYAIENELTAYEDSSKNNNETFHLFSQSDHEDDQQPPLKKSNTNVKASNQSAFNRVKPTVPPSVDKFKQTMPSKTNITPTHAKLPSTAVTDTPPSSIADTDLLQMIEKPIDAEINSEDLMNDFFSSW